MPGRATIGIDIGGTKTLLGLFDEDFKLIEEDKMKTHPEKGESHFTENLTERVENLLKTAEKKDLSLSAIGIGCAGHIDRQKRILKTSPNIPFLKGYDFEKHLGKFADHRLTLGNDVQMALYGEHTLGAAKEVSHAIAVFFGTGICGAAMLNGQLYLGATGAAGEIGSYFLSLAGPEREVTLDDFASRSAIAGEAARMANKQWAPHLYDIAGADLSEMNAGTLAEAIDKGDKELEKLVRNRAYMAGLVLSNLVNFLNPELVVIGGGLVDAMTSLFLKEIDRGIRERTGPEIQESLKVVSTKLKDHAVTAGAAKMAWDVFGKDDVRGEREVVGREAGQGRLDPVKAHQ